MNKTQTFEKLDKLTEGLRDISGLSDKEQKKTPERKKWRAAIDSLPKEEKNEYYDRAYQKSREDRIDKVGLLYQKEIRPNTSCIHFWLGEKIVKEEKLFNEKQNIEEQFSKKETPPIQNIGVPEIVDIDYSDIKDISTAKNGERLRPYRDGFLIIREDNPKSYHAFTLSHYKDTSKAEAKIFFHSLTFGVDLSSARYLPFLPLARFGFSGSPNLLNLRSFPLSSFLLSLPLTCFGFCFVAYIIISLSNAGFVLGLPNDDNQLTKPLQPSTHAVFISCLNVVLFAITYLHV